MSSRNALAAALLLFILFVNVITPLAPISAVGNIVVNTAQDVSANSQDGLCSLRVALLVAQNNSNAADDDCPTGVQSPGVLDVIQISSALTGQTLTLSGGVLPAISGSDNPVEIIGPTSSSSGFIISGSTTRIFDLGVGSSGSLTLSNLTLSNGQGVGSAGTTSGDGGAIWIGSGSLTLNNTVFSNNQVNNASRRGGAIFVNGSATITSNGGSFVGNSAESGGAIYIFDGGTTFNGYAITFDDNSAQFGGVIVSNPSSGSAGIHIERSTFKNNTAHFGGVFQVQTGSLLAVDVSDSTFSGNSAITSGGVIQMSSTSVSARFLRSTFYNNTATSGGLLRGGNYEFHNSIIYNSTCNLSSTTVSGSFNFVGGTTSGCPAALSDLGTITGFDMTLQNNGGALETHALLGSSNAIDAASASWCASGSVDQRSVARGANMAGAVNSPQAGDCDVGAYEYRAATISFDTTNTISMSEDATQANNPGGTSLPIRVTLPSDQPTLSSAINVTITPRVYSAACVDNSCSTGQQNIDYEIPSQTLIIPAGVSNGYTTNFVMYGLQDLIAEFNAEIIVFDLVTSDAGVAEPNYLRVSITDDDVAGIDIVESDGATLLTEADTNVTDTISVSLKSPPNFGADVEMTVTPDRDCTVNGLAQGEADSFTILNADWQTPVVITLHVVDDLYDEDLRDESATHQCEVAFTFVSSGGEDRSSPLDGIGDGDPVYDNTTNYAHATITDNDTAQVIISPMLPDELVEGTTPAAPWLTSTTYTVVLSTPPDPGKPLPNPARDPMNVVITPDAQCDVGAGAGIAIELPFTEANYSVPQTVTVQAADDSTVELTHACTITHSLDSDDPVYDNLDDAPDFAYTPTRAHTYTLHDFAPPDLLNDPPNVVIATTGSAAPTVSEAGTSDQFSVVLFRQPLNQNVTVTLTAQNPDPLVPGNQILLQSDGAPAASITLTFTPGNWNTPKIVSVFAVDDDYDELSPHPASITATMDSTAPGFDDSGNRKFVLNGVESINTVSIPVNVTDNDTAAIITSAGDGITLNEGSSFSDVYFFQFTSKPTSAVTVTVDPDQQCIVNSNGVPGDPVSFIIQADDWNVPQGDSAIAYDDLISEGDHTCVLMFTTTSTDTNYNNLAGTPLTANVSDNDLLVINANDSGAGSLRAALATADSAAGAQTVVFDSSYFNVARTINLSSMLTINSDVTIAGTGASLLTVSGQNNVRVFRVTAGTVTLQDLTVIGGTLSSDMGAGIYVDVGAALTLLRVTVSGGSAPTGGGGVTTWGTLIVQDSTFSGNTSPTGAGGGGAIFNQFATVTILRSTFSGNSTGTGGGAIFNRGGALTVTNSTFSANSATVGGALYNSGTLTVTNSTFSANSASFGGGIYDENSAAIRNSLFASSTCFGDFTGTHTSNAGTTGSGCPAVTEAATLNLGTLGSYGGSTQTIPLQSGSIAIDTGDSGVCPSTDQRSATRPLDGDSSGTAVCDIGAYELPEGGIAAVALSLEDATLTEAGDTATLRLTRTGGILTSPLSVSLTASGTAESGDYAFSVGGTPITDTVTFAANQTQVDVTVTAVDDVPAEPDESLTVSFLDGTSHYISAPTSAALTIPANDFAVTTLNDSGAGSLRQAITNANGIAGTDTVTFTVTGTINLSSALPNLSSNLNITGPGAGSLTVRRNTGGSYSVFTVSGLTTVSISGVTISNGANVVGGGIYNFGALTLTNVTVSGNTATDFGGGIYNVGTLSLTGSTVSGNTVTAFTGGGGILNNGTLTLTNSTISGNSTSGSLLSRGGGLLNSGGTAQINSSTVSGSSAQEGGGIYVGAGTVTLNASTITTNSAMLGGGAFVNGGTLNVADSTVSGNSAQEGGGVMNAGSSTLTITGSTFSGNNGVYGTVQSYGNTSVTNSTFSGNTGGTTLIRTNGSFTLTNVTVAGNSANSAAVYGIGGISNTIIANNSGANCQNAFGSTNNLSTDGTCTGFTQVTSGALSLSALANNGGSTQTMALGAGSAAIDTGNNGVCPSTDQRGASRPVDGDADSMATCDVGAYEAPASPIVVTVSPTDATLSETGDTTGVFRVSRTGTPSSALVVNIAVSGTATGTADYTADGDNRHDSGGANLR